MFAQRIERAAASGTQRITAEVDRLRRQGIDIVDLGAGEPDFATPPHVKAAAVAAIADNFTRYTPNAGVRELREAICARYRADYNVTFGPDQVIATAGGKQALFNAAMALYESGDEVITHAPAWPSIVEQVRLADAVPVLVRTHPEDGFRLHADAVLDALTPRTKAVVINSPGNPTGALVAEQDLVRIATEAAARGVWVVLDLCYEELIYDDAPHNLPRVLREHVPDRFVLAGSLSKDHAMTGWRCGWAIGPRAFIQACNTVQGHATSNVSSITQRAAIEALTGPQECVAAMREAYRERRDRLLQGLCAEPRIRCVRPGGAFYLFPDISDLLSPDGLRTSAAFAEALLRQGHVAVTPGEAFDAPGFIRLSYAASPDCLDEGVRRIRAFIGALGVRGETPRRTETGQAPA